MIVRWQNHPSVYWDLIDFKNIYLFYASLEGHLISLLALLDKIFGPVSWIYIILYDIYVEYQTLEKKFCVVFLWRASVNRKKDFGMQD